MLETPCQQKKLWYKRNMSTIKNIRKKHDITIREFAEALGMSYANLSLVENGKAPISIKALERIAKEFNEPLDSLLIAHGYLPEYTKDARQKDAEKINKCLTKVSKEIREKVDS